MSIAVNERGSTDDQRRQRQGSLKYKFKDALLFTSPCSLSQYLKQNGIAEEKSIYPYTAFNSVEAVYQQKTFPTHQQFYSELKGTNVSDEDYARAKAEYDRR